jgi:hypothetical protein
VLVLFEKWLGLGKRFQGQEKQPNLMVVDDKYDDSGVESRWRVNENSSEAFMLIAVSFYLIKIRGQ